MNKEDKKEITLGTTVKAVITGYVAYGILVGFILFIIGIFVNWTIDQISEEIRSIISFTVPLVCAIILFFIVRGIAVLSIHDVFKKCKTNPENLPRVKSRLNLCVLILIVASVVITILLLSLKFNNEATNIMIASKKYATIHSEEFTQMLTNQMYAEYDNERVNTIISTIVVELGLVSALFSLIPLQAHTIEKENKF